MIKLPGIKKQAYDFWSDGEDVLIDPKSVIAVEGRTYTYHSYRPPQRYSVVWLSTGASIEVMLDVDQVRLKLGLKVG